MEQQIEQQELNNLKQNSKRKNRKKRHVHRDKSCLKTNGSSSLEEFLPSVAETSKRNSLDVRTPSLCKQQLKFTPLTGTGSTKSKKKGRKDKMNITTSKSDKSAKKHQRKNHNHNKNRKVLNGEVESDLETEEVINVKEAHSSKKRAKSKTNKVTEEFGTTNDKEQVATEETPASVNAFKFMMDSRYKSIGQNSCGKELEREFENKDASKENRKKLSTRKEIFQNWADVKGASKRKRDDEEIDVIIDQKLEKRAKRLKKLLTQKQERNINRRLSKQIILSDSESNYSSVREQRNKVKQRKKNLMKRKPQEPKTSMEREDASVSKTPLLKFFGPPPKGNPPDSKTNYADKTSLKLRKAKLKLKKAKRELRLLLQEHSASLLKRTQEEPPKASKKSLKIADESCSSADSVAISFKAKKTVVLDSSDASSHDTTVENDRKKAPISSTPLQQKDLLNFFGVLQKADSSHGNKLPKTISKSHVNGDVTTTNTSKLSLRKRKDHGATKEKIYDVECGDEASVQNCSKVLENSSVVIRKKRITSRNSNKKKPGENKNIASANVSKDSALKVLGLSADASGAVSYEATVKDEGVPVKQKDLLSLFGALHQSGASEKKHRSSKLALKIRADGSNKKSKGKSKQNESTNVGKEESKEEYGKMSENKSQCSIDFKHKKYKQVKTIDDHFSSGTPRTYSPWKMKLKLNLHDESDENLWQHCNTDGSVILDVNSFDDEGFIGSQVQEKTAKIVVFSDSDCEVVPSAKVKLAPIFLKASPKTKADLVELEARQAFLHSQIPSCLKKTLQRQPSVDDVEFQIFPIVSHIRNPPNEEEISNSCLSFWNLPPVELPLIPYEMFVPKFCVTDLRLLTNSTCTNEGESALLRQPPQLLDLRKELQEIKTANPHYPVYKVFRSLFLKHTDNVTKDMQKKLRRGRPKKRKLDESVEIIETPSESHTTNVEKFALWTEKYKACTSEGIVGNNVSISELKKWLQGWVDFSVEVSFKQSKRKHESGSSSEFDTTDGDSRDSTRMPGNTVVLIGPNASGKSTAVYALCNELGVNVLELNASSKRTGKQLLQELQEATQSHQVRKNDSGAMATFLNGPQQFSKRKKHLTQTLSKKTCLLLVEDVDIVFEQDEGFINALAQLLSSSKRPVVLTTTNANCLHLQKFITQHRVITFNSFTSFTSAVWLQVVCLLENLRVSKDCVSRLLSWNNGDIRRTLLCLQFWGLSGGDSQDFTKIRNHVNDTLRTQCEASTGEETLGKDDTSCMQWLEAVSFRTESDTTCVNPTIRHTQCLKSFTVPFPLNIENLWCNLPTVFDSYDNSEAEEELGVVHKSLVSVCAVLEAMAFADVLAQKDGKWDVQMVPSTRRGRVMDGMEMTDRLNGYNSTDDLGQDLRHVLVEGCLNAWKPLDSNGLNVDLDFGQEVAERWREKQKNCRSTFLEIVPLSCHTDHTSLTLDYFSSLRTMARTESLRASTNSKRRNRFYNYLRGLGINCGTSTLESACNIFCTD